ncbi:DUF4373 domain-containing protein [Paenibacillus sp. HN-1]|uniref:DUF4373 domain-containing protein n=1 Tax=Paenibacillus TaxID=44249 RepID=UPI001CA99637|nr:MULTISPECIES: DUF4373 domain-containing protein [Paenibacillus]MBY9077255.1 DUF4373 domain-containing protein [Paenibacillus sp. CGMCC 1.18879]MBY9083302.1 DUF4373 domain-containing protein [Paenibacillus sinensis]
MARPKKEGMEYFPHDTDAVNDEKIEAMRALFGNDGYAFYFILLERIYRSENGELDVSSFTVRTALIKKLGIDQDQFSPMLEAAFEIGLFDPMHYEMHQCITSLGVKKRHNEVEKMRSKWRKKKGQNDRIEVISGDNAYDADVFPGDNDEKKGFSPEKGTQSKVKESKVNKNIKNICADSPAAESHTDEYHTDFERFWDVFPKARRRDKAKAYTAWKKKVKAAEREDLIRCTILYSQDTNAIGKDGAFAKMPTTYLNAGTYKDYLTGGIGNEEHGRNSVGHAGGNQTKGQYAFLDENEPYTGGKIEPDPSVF